jgi:exosortase
MLANAQKKEALTTVMEVVSSDAPRGSHKPRAYLWQTGILLVLIGWLYAPIASMLIVQFWQDPNYTYGLFVPVFSVFLLWQDRERVSKLKANPSWWGVVILLFALIALVTGTVTSVFFLPRVSLLLVISGVVVSLGGWEYLGAVSFPLAFLILLLPSASLISHLTFPLQIIASRISTLLLRLVGMSVIREGNIVLLPAARLQVAEACSGIQSLFSLLTLAIVYGYAVERKIRIRVLLAFAAIPISVAANALRIAVAGIVVQRWGAETTQGAFHTVSGWLIFMGALGMLLLCHRVLASSSPGIVDAGEGTIA